MRLSQNVVGEDRVEGFPCFGLWLSARGGGVGVRNPGPLSGFAGRWTYRLLCWAGETVTVLMVACVGCGLGLGGG
jgi:hypothetical protein